MIGTLKSQTVNSVSPIWVYHCLRKLHYIQQRNRT